jgi:hypothetical protein
VAHSGRHISWSITAITALAVTSWASLSLPLGSARPGARTVTVVNGPEGSVGEPAPAPTVYTETRIVQTGPPLAVQPASWQRPTPTLDAVFVGDSLAEQSAEMLEAAVAPMPVARRFFGGTAPCDWLPVGLPASPSSVVIISFSGNSLTGCMSDGAGGYLDGDALVAKYRADVGSLIDQARRLGARVLLVGQAHALPQLHADARVDALNNMYRSFAAQWPDVAFVDAGAAIETSAGEYADRLPCEAGDIDCAADGTTQIRSDGVHFCSVYGMVHCPVYASGARRFATVIADGVCEFASFE